MRKVSRVGGTLVLAGAAMAATLGTAFVVVGFACIFLGALVLAVALEGSLAPAPGAVVSPPAVFPVEAASAPRTAPVLVPDRPATRWPRTS